MWTITMRDLLLPLHAGAGTLGLLLGPLAVIAAVAGRTRLRDRAHHGYQVGVAGVCASALLLAGRAADEFWWLIPIALATQALAIVGARSERLAFRAHGLGGSYLALVTALLVVSWESPLAWALPAAVCLPLILHAAHGGRRRIAAT
jgi:hypothetical protein